MNKQGNKKIEYLDYTFNPLSGCLHPCKDKYCYAAKIAKRFEGNSYGGIGITDTQYRDTTNLHVIEELHWTVNTGKWRYAPYPFGFEPTFHRYRLDEPVKLKRPSVIGVVYMGDLFGAWVPYEWKYEVLEACQNAKQHTYIFLTKNPLGLENPFHLYFAHNKNWWIGTSVEREDDAKYRAQHLIDETTYETNRFLSIEPLLSDVGGLNRLLENRLIDWVIIGQQTGPGAVPPKPEWVQSIID